jgi:hypothetical protein
VRRLADGWLDAALAAACGAARRRKAEQLTADDAVTYLERTWCARPRAVRPCQQWGTALAGWRSGCRRCAGPLASRRVHPCLQRARVAVAGQTIWRHSCRKALRMLYGMAHVSRLG